MADEDLKERFSEKIAGCTDDEVIEILKKRSYYNPVAAEIAIREAIKRGLINSEDDLLAEEYRVKPLRFSLFPAATNQEVKVKLIKSLSRGILLAGLLPTALGVYKFTAKHFIEASFLFLVGAIWVVTSFLLLKYKRKSLVYLPMSMAVFATGYIAWLFLMAKYVRRMDLFIAIVFFGLVFYCLFYLNSILSKNQS
jgi:hypothetical protein